MYNIKAYTSGIWTRLIFLLSSYKQVCFPLNEILDNKHKRRILVFFEMETYFVLKFHNHKIIESASKY